MFCEKCGAQNPDDSLFCSACGSAIKSPGQTGGKATNPKDRISAAVPKKANVKLLATVGAAALVVVVLLVSLLGGKDGGQGGVSKGDLTGKWYSTSSSGTLRIVFWFQKDGTLTSWQEAGGFSDDTDKDYGAKLASWKVSGSTLRLSYSEDQALLVESYFGTGTIELELSDNILTIHTNRGNTDLILQKYPEDG